MLLDDASSGADVAAVEDGELVVVKSELDPDDGLDAATVE